MIAPERRDGYVYSIFDDTCRPPIEDLIALTDAAWGADYKQSNRAMFRYDSHYLNWLMPDGHFFGVWVATEDGRPVGCLMHVERDLFCKGKWYRAFYGTLLSVLPDHRGRGLAERLMHRSFDWIFKERRADLEVGVFDIDQAGRPAITKAVQRYDPAYTILETRPMPIWACTADILEATRYEPLEGISRVAMWPGFRDLFAFRPSADEKGRALVPAPLADARDLEQRFTLGFGAGTSVAQMYPPATSDDSSGTVGFEFGSSQRCLISYHVLTLVKPGLPDGRLGMLQFVDPQGTSPANLVRALRTLSAALIARGCFTVIYLNAGTLPTHVLLRAMFLPTPRTLCFEFTGRREAVEPFRDLRPPFFVDMY